MQDNQVEHHILRPTSGDKGKRLQFEIEECLSEEVIDNFPPPIGFVVRVKETRKRRHFKKTIKQVIEEMLVDEVDGDLMGLTDDERTILMTLGHQLRESNNRS